MLATAVGLALLPVNSNAEKPEAALEAPLIELAAKCYTGFNPSTQIIYSEPFLLVTLASKDGSRAST